MTRRTFLARIAAWLGITREPPKPDDLEHDGRYDFDECPACIAAAIRLEFLEGRR